jgi:hypothetical protein
LNLHIQFGDHAAGGPFGKNLMQNLIEKEIQEIEAQKAAQVINMESDDNAFYRSTPTLTLLRAFSLSQCCYHGAGLSYLLNLNI